MSILSTNGFQVREGLSCYGLRLGRSNLNQGKNWKVQKSATVRNQQPKQLRRSWDQRSKERARNDAVKTLERQLKADKQAAKDVSAVP